MRTVILSLVILIMGCNGREQYQTVTTEGISKANVHPGKNLMETNCNVCHSPTASQNNRLAPPMTAVKMHYFSKDITKEEFISNIQNWVSDPNEENARMFGAVRRFGLMAKSTFPEETVKLIADYMYSHDLDQPEWFEEHAKQMGNCNQ